MNNLEFKKTGNFWIDNGIVGLHKVLRTIKSSGEAKVDFDLKLNTNGLIIRQSEESLNEGLLSILNLAKTEVVKTYLKSTGAGWIYKEGNFEVYRKTDFKMHLKSFFTGKTPRTEGALCVPDAKDSELGGRGRRMNETEYTRFLKFKEANSPVIINDKKFPLAGKGFLNSPPQYEIGEDFQKAFLSAGKRQCLFSGQMYQIADVITGMDYPFLTGKSGELNFVSQLEGKPMISAQYAFVALFSFYNLYYQLQNDVKSYFVLYDSNLKELNNFYNDIEHSLSELKNVDYCNFATYISGTQYGAESLINFLVSIYKQVKAKLDYDVTKGVISKSVYTLSNDGNIFRDVKEYTSIAALFSLFEAFSKHFEEKSYFEDFLNLIRFFSKKIKNNPPEYDTTWRNRLCADILAFQSIHKTIEWFIGEVKMKEDSGSIYQLDKILEIYNYKTQPHMDKEMVSKCKSIGTTIGIYSQKEDDKGALFSLRNAKNRIEFLKVLSHIQFRIASSEKVEPEYKLRIYDDFFEKLPNDQQWEEYKALVSIFAMNSFLFKKKEVVVK